MRPHALTFVLLAATCLSLAAHRSTRAGTGPGAGFQFTVLSPLGGTSCRANDLNNEDQVCGEARTAANRRRACIWTDGGAPLDLGTLPGHTDSACYGINDFGQACGESLATSNTRHAFLWTPLSPNGATGSMVDLGTLGGAQSFAAAVNNDGLTVGWAHDASNRRHAVVWIPSGFNGTEMSIIDLGIPPGGTSSAAQDINDAAGICGDGTGASGPSLLSWQPASNSEIATSWTLNDHGRPTGIEAISAQSIDRNGIILLNGAREIPPSDTEVRSYLFTAPRTYVAFPAPEGATTLMLDRHVTGENVGTRFTATGSEAVIGSDGGTTVVPLPAATNPEVKHVDSATAINESGQIAANVTNSTDQPRAAFAVPTQHVTLKKEVFRDGAPLVGPVVEDDRVTFVITATNDSEFGIPDFHLRDEPQQDGYGLERARFRLETHSSDPDSVDLFEADHRLEVGFGTLAAGQTVRLKVTARFTEGDYSYRTGNGPTNHAYASGSAVFGEGPGVTASHAVKVPSAKVRDATSEVNATAGPVNRNGAKVTITNTPGGGSSALPLARKPKGADGDLPAPLYLILDNLQNASLVKASGVTTTLAPLGSPYLTLKSKGLPTGKKLTAKLKFTPDADGGAITFSTRVAVGPSPP